MKSVTSVNVRVFLESHKTTLIVLWVLAAKGGTDATNAFLTAVKRLVTAGCRSDEDAGQEALIYLWRHMSEYDSDKADISTWIYQACRYGRQAAKRKGGQLLTLTDAFNEDKDVQNVPSKDKTAQYEEEMEAVCGFLEQQDMDILSWYFLEGLTFSEIAGKLDCTKPTARNRLLSVINKCRKHFGTRGFVTGVTKWDMTVTQ